MLLSCGNSVLPRSSQTPSSSSKRQPTRNQKMCWTRTTDYTICSHRRTTEQRCEKYLSKPRKRCEKFHYSDTVLDLCPTCYRTPSQSASILPLVFYQRSGVQSVQSSQATTIGDGDDKGSELSARKKALGGLRRRFGGVRRDGGWSNKDNQSEAGNSQHMEAARTSKKTEGSVRSSEQLAEEYRGIIGHHPNVAPSTYGRVGDTAVPKAVDIETCTTCSRFLPGNDPSVQGGVGEAATAARRGVRKRLEAVEPDMAEVLRMTEVIEGRRARNNTKPLVLVRAEELKKAEEKFARVRDGRGAMRFDR